MADNNFDFSKLLGSARQMQEQLESTQKALAAIQITGAAAGGMVTVVINGERRVLRVDISEEALADGDMLQDLITAAVNDALRKVEQAINEKMRSSLASGLAGIL